MKKFAVCALIIGIIAVMAVPSMAWDAAKQKSLGQDKNKMTWYLLDYWSALCSIQKVLHEHDNKE